MMGGREELQRKAPNWLSQGPGLLSEGILLYTYKKIPVFFSPYTSCILELVSKTSQDFSHCTFPYIYIPVDIISNSHF